MNYINALGGTDKERAAVLSALDGAPNDLTAEAVTQWRARGRPSYHWIAFLQKHAFLQEAAGAE